MGKKYNIRYLELARSDLLGIAEYVHSQALERGTANRPVDSLEKAILPGAPLRWRWLYPLCEFLRPFFEIKEEAVEVDSKDLLENSVMLRGGI